METSSLPPASLRVAPGDLSQDPVLRPLHLEGRDSVAVVDDNRGLWFALACLAGVALWNAGEIILVVLWTFKRRRTLYFWSMIAAALGVITCSAAQIIDFALGGINAMPAVVLGSAGWVPMVTGQSLVLYSRLHLLWVENRTMRLLLAMIVFNAVTMHTAAFVINVSSRAVGSDALGRAYEIVERLEVTVFCLQEFTLSLLYLWRCKHFLQQYGRRMESEDNTAMRSTLRSLILANLVVLLLDASVLVLEFMGYNYVQIKVKDFIYSFKLKVELGALNSLRDFVRHFRMLDSTFKAKEQKKFQAGIQRQWESALQRAFGTVAVTRPGEPEEVHVAEGHQILVRRQDDPAASAEGLSVEARSGPESEKHL